MTPDFSPSMLRVFLRIRAMVANPKKPARGKADLSRRLRRRARITVNEFEFAWMGRLNRAAPRVRLWAALGVVPGDQGVMLMDDGTQEVVRCAAE